MMGLKKGFYVFFSISVSILILGGCSSRLQTRIVSQDLPQKAEVVQHQEPMQESEAVMEGPKMASSEATTVGVPSFDIPVELPPQPVIRERQLQSIFAKPQEKPGLKSSPFTELAQPTDRLELEEEPISQPQPIEIAKLVPSEQEIHRVESVERKKELFKILEDVYFDYDRFGLREEEFPELAANAELLASQLAGETIVLQGHCDERGTESYNMILGKRRAGAVKDFLVDLGVPDDNLVVMSFGKDKPFCTEQTRACWQENRRVHFEVQ